VAFHLHLSAGEPPTIVGADDFVAVRTPVVQTRGADELKAGIRRGAAIRTRLHVDGAEVVASRQDAGRGERDAGSLKEVEDRSRTDELLGIGDEDRVWREQLRQFVRLARISEVLVGRHQIGNADAGAKFGLVHTPSLLA
jgi:hypothetical protein